MSRFAVLAMIINAGNQIMIAFTFVDLAQFNQKPIMGISRATGKNLHVTPQLVDGQEFLGESPFPLLAHQNSMETDDVPVAFLADAYNVSATS
jgi:hypothetical protein